MFLGGEVNKNFFNNHFNNNKYDIIIAVDKGLQILDYFKIKPNYIVGDFDSIDNEILKKYEDTDISIERLVPEKDLTDTESAIKLAVSLRSSSITIIGAMGTRIDHMLANIHILEQALNKQIKARMINENNEIQLINDSLAIKKDDRFKYISVIPLTTEAKGVTIKGMKYPLNNYTLTIGNSLGVSNEQVDEIAEITVKEGILIIIKSND